MKDTDGSIVRPVVAQHAEEAAFLWLLRDGAVSAPHYTLPDLEALDTRLEAHLDGLRVAGAAGLEMCMAALEKKEPGEAFAASILALERSDGEAFSRIAAAAEGEPALVRALVSSLGWVSEACAGLWVDRMVNAAAKVYRRVGIGALAVNRRDPGERLVPLIAETDVETLCRALRAVGELRRQDARAMLGGFMRHQHPEVQLWASWSAALLGDASALNILAAYAASGRTTANADAALQLVTRLMTPETLQSWIKRIAQGADRRTAVVACGLSGDPYYIPWLMAQMETAPLARAAGEAFSFITGVDLALEDLEGEWPDGFDVGPTDHPGEEDVDLDPDDNLPWPQPELVRKWWTAHGGAFRPDVRYLCGRPISRDACLATLEQGYQRQRIAAAYELALMNPTEALFEWRAPGFRQQLWLGAAWPRPRREPRPLPAHARRS